MIDMQGSESKNRMFSYLCIRSVLTFLQPTLLLIIGKKTQKDFCSEGKGLNFSVSGWTALKVSIWSFPFILPLYTPVKHHQLRLEQLPP